MSLSASGTSIFALCFRFILSFFNSSVLTRLTQRKRRQLPYLLTGPLQPLISYGGSLRLSAAPTDIRFCSSFSIRGSGSSGEFEQICLEIRCIIDYMPTQHTKFGCKITKNLRDRITISRKSCKKSRNFFFWGSKRHKIEPNGNKSKP